MHPRRPNRSTLRLLAAASLPIACTGCDMLGELFRTPGLRVVVLAVVVLAAIGFLVSRSGRR